MISPTLVDSQIEIIKGEAIVEVIRKSSRAIRSGSSTRALRSLRKLRRVSNHQPEPAVSVYAGKAAVDFNGSTRKPEVAGHEIILAVNLPEQRFDTKSPDELYAWSNIRSEYDAGASYAAASALSTSNNGGGYYPNYTPGWY